VIPALQQAPGAGDRDIGKHWRDHVGCSLQHAISVVRVVALPTRRAISSMLTPWWLIKLTNVVRSSRGVQPFPAPEPLPPGRGVVLQPDTGGPGIGPIMAREPARR
jgi:hypothetical protein